MTLDGEEYIPFHLYVQPNVVQSRSSSETSLFADFNRLPAELQLRILTFCSPSTLYHLMHTSMFRTDAAKVFWTDPNTHYLIESDWLFKGGHSGHTYYDLSFMAYAQNVEIRYDAEVEVIPVGVDRVEHRYAKAQELWKTFQTRFPCAKRVVVNHNWESQSIRQLDDEPVPSHLKVILEKCPDEIDVLILVLLEVESGGCEQTAHPVANNWHRILYQLTNDGGWKKVTCGFERKTVLMPPKRFHGPVGEFKGLVYQGDRIRLQKEGLGALAIEAMDRHYFDKKDPEPFHCAVPGCDLYLERAGQWTQHAAEAHACELIPGFQFDILPNALQDIFKNRENSLDQEAKAVGRKLSKIFDDWNKKGDEKRRELQREWIYQLENDEAWDTGTKGRESEIWSQFTMWVGH
jgi:hypothetical protein